MYQAVHSKSCSSEITTHGCDRILDGELGEQVEAQAVSNNDI